MNKWDVVLLSFPFTDLSATKVRPAVVISPDTYNQTSQESERFKSFAYDDLVKRDKVNLDIFWLKDDSLEESANLPAPHVIAEDITEDLETAWENFAAIAEDVKR